MSIHNALEREISRRVQIILSMGIGLFALGTGGYMLLEEWPFLDALYMTTITLATVGFSEVNTLDPGGRIFTIVLIIFGLGVFGYTVSNITSIVVEGHLTNYFRVKAMNKKISELENHIILCGYGRVGKNVAEILRNEKKSFVIIEKDARVCDALAESGQLVITGDSTDDDILENAGLSRAYGLIAALENDVKNLFVVLSARRLNKNLYIVSRVEDDANQKKILAAGADKIVSPAHIGGYRMAVTMLRPQIVNFLDVIIRQEGVDLSMQEFKIRQDCELTNKSIEQASIPSKLKVIGYVDSGGAFVFNPDSSTILNPGSTLILFGESKIYREFFAQHG